MTLFSTLVTASPNKPFLGISFSEHIKEDTHGVLVNYVVPNTAAEKASIQKNDFIYMVDLETFPTNNITTYFKNYISKEKKIGDILKLKILRESLSINKLIDDNYINVDFKLNNIINEINSLDYNKESTFKFKKTINSLDIQAFLEPKPMIKTTSPNIKLELLTELNFTAPYTTYFFKNLETLPNYAENLTTLKHNQYLNEFWDDNHRSSIIKYLHVNPEKLPAFTKVLNQKLLNMTPQQLSSLSLILNDIKPIESPSNYPHTTDVNTHVNYLISTTKKASKALTKAFSNLSEEDIVFLNKTSLSLTKKLNKSFLLSDLKSSEKEEFIKFFNLFNKIDLNELQTGFVYLNTLSQPHWLESFKKSLITLKPKPSTVAGITGDILLEKETDLGLLVIGSSNKNTYNTNIAFLIDLAGDDIYKNNAGGTFDDTFISYLIDFSGNDIYSSHKPFSQGASQLGYGLLIDSDGNDHYQADTLSQGSTICGVAYLIDEHGNDIYNSLNYSQGFALYGQGTLLDFSGNDSYNASLFSQGVGITKGIGIIADNKGDDHYALISNKKSSYGSAGIFKGAGQGFGFGVRHFSSGGIGLLVDTFGNDTYIAGNFSQGTGYFYGLGIHLDKYGDDHITGSRYSMGTAAHSALGIIANMHGNDTYKTLQGSSLGIGWDNSNVYFLDAHGNDTYDCLDKSFCMGQTDHNSFAFFNDKQGRDIYEVNLDKPEATNSYNEGKSLGIFLDEQGSIDKYNDLNLNNSINTTNTSHLFIDTKDSLIFLDF